MISNQIISGCLGVCLLCFSGAGYAESPNIQDHEVVIQPEIDRRDIRIPKIKAEDYEAGAYLGILSIEDFGARPVYGLRLAYHVSESFFVEAMYGMSTISDEAFRNVGLSLLPNEVEDLRYYALSVGYNMIPSEFFFGKKRAMNSTVYLIGGVGSTSYVNENLFTANVGLGLRLLPKDWLSVHIVMRDFLYKSDFLGTSKITNNFELTFGMSVYF